MSIKSVLSGVTSSARNPVGTGLTALTIIEGINKNPVNPVILSKKFRRLRLSSFLKTLYFEYLMIIS